MGERKLWSGEPVGGNPFALPRGPLGVAAGWVLARANRRQQAEILEALAPGHYRSVLEVGCGPGVLLDLLASAPGVEEVAGVDPSRQMVSMARRRNAAALRAGRLRVHPGSAGATGEPDAAFDLVVTVNTVAMWPSLDDSLAELYRVLRPGGRAAVSWHGASSRFALTDEEDARVLAALRRRFGAAERRELGSAVLFEARR
ncbi:class I SAM-dependent methyltransferase [Streptomonospora wellingtoniae]|uniref:Methyltransferase domain-containing protein n=1 Tax=Streptomonospora wellingtoniae TaxID=3075544 RepID=A0ABU2KNZ7_9ACTN|nr:methyltransferase domain-containing protein [Streptomonospora sp. DSM 45055]MDT0300978.1 methyltransferase domain-containing protein [Streptomonospora sp. DSM 45055]